MAKEKKDDKAKAEGAAAPKKSSMLSVIISVVLVTLVAGGGGFAFGTLVFSSKPTTHAAAEGAAESGQGEAAGEAKPGEEKAAEAHGQQPGQIVRQLSPIVTNLQSPKETWIRLEMSVVLKPEAASEQDLIAVRAGDRVLGLLRSITLSQIDGPSGLLHLREDLTDLLVEGHDSQITQVLINSMVVE